MKKAVLLLSVFLLASLVIGFASAVQPEITLSKSGYYPGETLEAEFPDVFLSTLTLNNISIYEGNSAHKSPVQSGLVKSESRYLYYAVLPLSSGSYSLKIENTKYSVNNVVSEDDIIKNFSISGTNTSYLSFNPGIISATSTFSIIVTAYNSAQNITASFAPSGFEQSFNLGNGNAKTLFIPITGINSFTKSEVKINSYSLPAFVSPIYQPPADNETPSDEDENVTGEIRDLIDVETETLEASVLEDIDFYFDISIVNKDAVLRNISITTSDDEITAEPDFISRLDGEEVINITINSGRAFDGYIEIEYKGDSIKVPVIVTLAENASEIYSNIPSANEGRSCSELGGLMCDSAINEQCTGSETYADNGICCLGQCKVKSSSAWIWGVVILLVVAGAGWFLYQKSKKGAGAGKSSDLFKKKTEDYEKRFNPAPAAEVRKSISRQ